MASVSKMVTTKILTEDFSFTWKIARFPEIRSCQRVLELQKCQLEVGRAIGIPTNWLCYLQCERKDERDWIGVRFKLENFPDSHVSEVLSNVTVSYSYNAEQDWGRSEDKTFDMLRNESVGWNNLFPQDENSPWLSEDLVDYEGNLCLQIKIKMFNSLKTIIPKVQKPLSTLEHQFEALFRGNFQRDMANMYNNPFDHASGSSMIVKVICKDGKENYVHGGILAVRCPNLLNGQETVVRLDDISDTAFKYLSHFLHAGYLAKDWKHPQIIEEVIIAAYKYKIEDLQTYLDQVLGLVCTQKNYGKLLSLAIKYNMKRAEKDLTEYFKNNWQNQKWEYLERFISWYGRRLKHAERHSVVNKISKLMAFWQFVKGQLYRIFNW